MLNQDFYFDNYINPWQYMDGAKNKGTLKRSNIITSKPLAEYYKEEKICEQEGNPSSELMKTKKLLHLV